MQMEFSLILPVYNVAAYLERCLKSILGQDTTGCEIILVDDGSTDASSSICDAYAAKHQEIRVVHQENGGLSSARNAGLRAARGKYIWFIDSDDWIAPDALSILRMACSDGADVVKFAYQRVEGDQSWVVRSGLLAGDYAGDRMKDIRQMAFREPGKYILSACFHVYRRELLLRQGITFVSERRVGSEDFLFNLQVLSGVCSLRVLEQPLYSYELRSGSLTQSRKVDLPQRYAELHTLLKAFYTQRALMAQYEGLIDRFYVWHLIYGTCFYDAYVYSSTVKEGRRAVREMLMLPQFRQAVRRSDRVGLSSKKRILLAAMILRMEWVFHYLFVSKPARKSR